MILNLFQKGHPGIEQVDHRALKWQRDRDKYTSLTKEQKAATDAKAMENYHKRKAKILVANTAPGTPGIAANMARETPGIVAIESNQILCSNFI